MRMRTRDVLAQAARLPRLHYRTDFKRSVVQWSPAHERLLGLAPDEQLAEIWHTSSSAVWYRRRCLCIPAHGKSCSKPQIIWTPAMRRDLGRITDCEFAKRYGISSMMVRIRRDELGIRKYSPRRFIHWTPAMLRCLGRETDLAISQRYNLPDEVVSGMRHELGIPCAPVIRATKHPWSSPHMRKLLGSAPDTEIAKQLGVFPDTVRIHRSRMGIPAFRKIVWTKVMLADLGTASDEVIAKRYGLSHSAVKCRRQRLFNMRT